MPKERRQDVPVDTVRKELPFAGYSVVKEHSVLVTSESRVRTFSSGHKRRQPFAWPPNARRGVWPDIGGEYRARTGDLLVANQALSQLS